MSTPIHSRPLSRQGRENHDRIFRRDRTDSEPVPAPAPAPAPAITPKCDVPMPYAGIPIEEPDT